MSATLLELPSKTPETLVPCTNCPALHRFEGELGELRREVSELRCDVGYWKSRHADALKRNEQLTEELHQARGQIRGLQDKLFGRKSEKSARSDRSNDLFDPEELAATVKRRGAQPGHAGHDRRDYSHLPVEEEFIPLPTELLACPICGKPATMMSSTEDSELLEIEVRAHRRRIRRRRYRATCDCDLSRRTLMAPPPPKLIPKGNYGISIWVHVLLDKYSSYRPTERLLSALEQYDLDLPAGTVNDGLRRIEPMLRPLVDDPRIPMDNNASERAGRGPAVARKNFYGSGSLWSGQLAAAMFSLLATLAYWELNPRRWLTSYLESCAAVGGKAPEDIQPFLPWNLSDERRLALGAPVTAPSADNTS